MFVKSQFEIQFAYHWATNQRLFECAESLEDAEYMHHPGYGYGSVHDLFFHILETDFAWRLGLETGKQSTLLRAEDYPTLQTLISGFEAEQGGWRALIETYSDAEISESMALSSWRGDVRTLPRWRILQHIVLHGMQHHAEIAQLLTLKGQLPGNIDFIYFE